MGSRAKTRFIVEYDGQLRQLFSIEEQPSGDLTIPIKHEEQHGLPADLQDIREQRLSVHCSPGSPGTTIKRHNVLANLTAITNAAFIRDSKETLLAALWTKAGPELIERYALRAKRKDRLINIGQFRKEHLCTLIYTVLVGEPKKLWPLIQGSTLHVAEFRRFSIAVYSTYMNWPGAGLSITYMLGTSPQRVNGVSEGPEVSDGAASLILAELDKVLLDMTQMAAANLMERLAEEVMDDDAAAFIRTWPMWFYPSGFDVMIGEYNRLSQESSPLA
jgi:hypothetical protein